MLALQQVFKHYKEEKRAIPAINIDCFEIYQAVEEAVGETNLPCIVQLSAGEDKFVGAERLLMLVKKAQVDGLPIFLNMDHGQDVDRLIRLAMLGYDMVHFDGSKLDYKVNLEVARTTANKVHIADKLIELEFDRIGGGQMTDPQLATGFVAETKADLLAVSIGNKHGVDTTSPEKIDLELLARIASALPNTFLTLHGGSGIEISQVKEAIRLGIVKININTDLRLKYKETMAKVTNEVVSEKIYDYLQPVVEELKKVVLEKLESFRN